MNLNKKNQSKITENNRNWDRGHQNDDKKRKTCKWGTEGPELEHTQRSTSLDRMSNRVNSHRLE